MLLRLFKAEKKKKNFLFITYSEYNTDHKLFQFAPRIKTTGLFHIIRDVRLGVIPEMQRLLVIKKDSTKDSLLHRATQGPLLSFPRGPRLLDFHLISAWFSFSKNP